MILASNISINGGEFIQNRTSKGMDILMGWVATGAFHNSDELYDAPKCHPHTRVAVLSDIMQWVSGESESAQDDFMMWLFGPAGAGKSAIAKRIAEIAAEKDLLIADFFFSKTSQTRSTKDRLIATLAYQLTLSIPGTRFHIEDAIERDPAIFNKNVQTQIDTLLIKPFRSANSAQITPSPKLIIIDGLDECNDRQGQKAILEAISRSFPQHNLPIRFLLVSRPETDIVTSFDCIEPLKSIHRRLALDNTYRPYNDIHLFFSDKFEQIRLTHPLKSTIPVSWPTPETMDVLVRKSSGQFIYASTVVKFVESSSHQPSARLSIILGISPPGKTNPFAELDALYSHLLSSVDDIQTTLRVLSLFVMIPDFAYHFYSRLPAEPFLSLEPGDIQLALINLSSILTYKEKYSTLKILHASFVDFLSDQRRSTTFYIDKTTACTNFFRRTLQCVKGPDGIRAGDLDLFRGVKDLWPIYDDQLRSDILNFDIDAFVDASIRCYYKEDRLSIPGSTIAAFEIWKGFLELQVEYEGLEYTEPLDRLNKSFESRLQIYQSDWRLQLLLTLAAANLWGSPEFHTISFCRYADILLGTTDDHYLHLVDQHALDFRHTYTCAGVRKDGDAYASAALYCMRFLANPPKYSRRNGQPEMGLIYPEWKATCMRTLNIPCKLLKLANTLQELAQFISKHDIHPVIQKNFSASRIWKVNEIILEFLDRANVSTVIQRSPEITEHLSGYWSEDQASWRVHSSDPESEYDKKWIRTPRYLRQRMDMCCSNVHRCVRRD